MIRQAKDGAACSVCWKKPPSGALCFKDRDTGTSLTDLLRFEVEDVELAIEYCDLICWNCLRLNWEEWPTVTESDKIILEAKDVPCVDCGVKYPPRVMDFDHVYYEKDFNVGKFQETDKSIRELYYEIAKCQIRCANCHRARHQKENAAIAAERREKADLAAATERVEKAAARAAKRKAQKAARKQKAEEYEPLTQAQAARIMKDARHAEKKLDPPKKKKPRKAVKKEAEKVKLDLEGAKAKREEQAARKRKKARRSKRVKRAPPKRTPLVPRGDLDLEATLKRLRST